MATPPKIVTLTANGTSEPIPIDLDSFKFGVGLIVAVTDGTTVGYDVEVTGDRMDTPNSAKLWNKHDCLQGMTAAANGNLAFPVTAVRLNASTVSGGTLQLSVVQATS